MVLAGMLMAMVTAASASTQHQHAREGYFYDTKSSVWLPEAYPSPDQEACRSGSFTRLCDPDSILAKEGNDARTTALLGETLEANRSILCNNDNTSVQFAVALLQKVCTLIRKNDF